MPLGEVMIHGWAYAPAYSYGQAASWLVPGNDTSTMHVRNRYEIAIDHYVPCPNIQCQWAVVRGSGTRQESWDRARLQGKVAGATR